MIPLGTQVQHALNNKLTGIIVGYGTIVNPYSSITHGVYLVKQDDPIEAAKYPFVSLSIAAWQYDRVEKVKDAEQV